MAGCSAGRSLVLVGDWTKPVKQKNNLSTAQLQSLTWQPTLRAPLSGTFLQTWRKDVVNQCLEFADNQLYKINTLDAVDRNSSELHYGCQVLDGRKLTSTQRQQTQRRSHDHTFTWNTRNVSLSTVLCRLSFTAETLMSHLCPQLKTSCNPGFKSQHVATPQAKPYIYKLGISVPYYGTSPLKQPKPLLVSCPLFVRLL